MSEIRIKDAVKKYGNNTIIKELSLEIKDGEFFTLLGPSGCGKTTLLRMIAGFNSIEGGNFYFNDTKINDMDPSKRNIGMVFQNYAIFPHLTVRQNVEFGLKNRKASAEHIKNETDKFLEAMQISEYQERLPERLSGGQQQRVALARALVIKPDVLLMDEPLSNLDAKLRLEMRVAIRNIQREVGITTVYVTHDQEEAMAISDRIAVMKDGVIQHIGTPKSIYQRPRNIFVATFIGRTNMIKAHLSGGVLTFTNGYKVNLDALKTKEDQEVLVSIRPEEFVISHKDEGFKATLNDFVFLGLNTQYFTTLETGEEVLIIEESSIDENFSTNGSINLTIKKEKINVFTVDGEKNLLLDD